MVTLLSVFLPVFLSEPISFVLQMSLVNPLKHTGFRYFAKLGECAFFLYGIGF